MNTKIDQKAYLQKYLSGPSSKSGDKKKKRKKNVKGTGLKIIDDDIDFSKLRELAGDEVDILGGGEDAPQIAGIIDDRPEEVKKSEQFKTTSKWRVITQDDGFNSSIKIDEIKKSVKEKEKENEIIFGKMYSDSEDEAKKDSDQSPPRKPINTKKKLKSSKQPANSDLDASPPRKNSKEKSKYDSDQSPPRKHEREKPNLKHSKKPDNSDSDLSPPRKRDNKESRKPNYDSDPSPPRRHEKQSDERKQRKKPSRWAAQEQDIKESRKKSPKRKSRRSPSSDLSPPRKSRKPDKEDRRQESDRRRNRTPDSDMSPPRKKKASQRDDKRDRSDSDPSPPRRSENRPSTSKSVQKYSPIRNNSKRKSDSDASPPRREKKREDRYGRSSDSPPPTSKRMEKTLEGKLAGLQDARQLRKENEDFRRREEEVFNKMTDDVSGRNAKAVSRKNKRETSQEKQQQKEKAERQKLIDEKYKKWSKGVKQIEAQQERLQDYMHEASKPLARHKGDRDLEHSLKQIERAGDPMLDYIRQKKRENGQLGPEKPSYKGQYPPNRFNIRPGYRWDGVDRSNGYENKYFQHQSKRKAMEEEAYKWSVEDL